MITIISERVISNGCLVKAEFRVKVPGGTLHDYDFEDHAQHFDLEHARARVLESAQRDHGEGDE